MQPSPTYFDTVSNDALTHIVYQIKKPTPSLLFWTPLVSASKSLFHTVILDTDCHLSVHLGRGTIKFGNRDEQDGGLSTHAVEHVLRIIGRFITSVWIVADDDYDGDDSSERWIDYASFITLLLEHCKRVDALEFMGSVPGVEMTQFLMGYGTQLIVLEVPAEINSVPIHRAPSIIPKLRMFSFYLTDIHKISELWSVSGDALEEVFLDILHIDDFNSVVADMRPHCPKLRRLMLFESEISPVIPKQEHVELLMSYGHQLVEAQLDMLGVCELKQLVVHCPNLRCAVRERLGRVERVFAAAPITKHLNVMYSGGEDALFAESLALCKNLIHLDLCHENTDLKSIITAPLSSLEKLEISVSLTEEEVELIARFTTRLKSLDVKFRTMGDASVFEILASTNGATLEEVRMLHYRDAGGQHNVVKWMGELMDYFLTRCERLQFFWIMLRHEAPDKNALSTLFLPLKRRGVKYELIFLDHIFVSYR